MVSLLRISDMGCTETEDEAFSSAVCSGRGECGPNNSCICEIRFTGENCLDYNKSYHAGESIEIAQQLLSAPRLIGYSSVHVKVFFS